MTLTPEQLDELEARAKAAQRAAAEAAYKGVALPFHDHEAARSADVTLHLVAVYRAALAWRQATDAYRAAYPGSPQWRAAHEQVIIAKRLLTELTGGQ